MKPKALLVGFTLAITASMVYGLEPVAGAAQAERLTPQEVKPIKTIPVTPKAAAPARAASVSAAEDQKDKPGDFKATSLSPSATWSSGTSTGGFTWSYPLRVPPAPGGKLVPEVSLSYSSQSADGRTDATNNQTSWVGDGFDYWPGFIERRYKSCAEDLGGNNGQRKTGDLCWARDNLTLSLNGSVTELIVGSDGRWHPRTEDGTKVESHGFGNGTHNGQAWKVTKPDGTAYFFGTSTDATWTVPVFGNNAGEPCNKATFDASSCNQGWRWNLNFAQDLHGNTIRYVYNAETNNYARNLDTTKSASYVRGGWLDRIEYGGRIDASGASNIVRFEVADRTDVPDKSCSGTNCDGKWSPTFWTKKRLAKVTTQVWTSNGSGGGAYRDVDSWTLRHTYPDPRDGTKAALWLAGLTHTGLVGGSVSLPEVVLEGTPMNNRVDRVDHSAPFNWYRLTRIVTESGAEISISYAAPECVAGSHMPGAQDSNTMRCYPVRWTPEGLTDPVLDWFHKHVVESVSETDMVGGAPRVLTRYEYGGGGAWRKAEEDGIAKAADLTWSQWRGYGTVRVRKGEGGAGKETLSETVYYRGMNGDHLANGARRSVSVADGDGRSLPDENEFAGMPRETRTLDASNGATIEATAKTAWRSNPTASRTIGRDTAEARHVGVSETRTRVALDGGRDWRRTRTATTFDGFGMPVIEEDEAGDTRCTRTTYARNEQIWLLTPVKRVEKYALACDKQPSSAAEILSDVKASFDGNGFDTAPGKGDVTQVDTRTDWDSYLTTSRSTYDHYGRVTATWDAMNHKTSTEYVPTMGPVTKTVITNPLSFVDKTELEPAWGAKTTVIDANNKRIDVTYDALGRTTAVWLPGRAKSSQTPNHAFTYGVRKDGANWVTTTKLLPDGTTAKPSYSLLDSLLRPRQTQEPAVGGGRVITDIYYDAAGRTVKTNGKWFDIGGDPGPDLVSPVGEEPGDIDNQIPAQTLTAYDGAGRKTRETLRSYGTERWHTDTHHGGDHTDVTPPGGGTPTGSWTDARGQTVELRQYHGTSPSGAFDATRYGYDPGGHLTSVTDPAGNTWRYGYDLRGRKVETTDPDKGVATTTYDDLDHPVSISDSRGVTLVTDYDALGRKTALSQGGTKRIEWTYDTLAKGHLTASTRYEGTNAYTVAVFGYTDRYQPTGTVVTIPAAEGALAGRYTTRAGYHVDGSPSSITFPAAGGLPVETVSTAYNEVGLPKTMTGTSTYVTGTAYTRFGELSVLTMQQNTMGDSGPILGPYVQRGLYYEEATRKLAQVTTLRETGPAFLSDVHYTYDDAGNITKAANTPKNGTADTQCFDYDYLRRLTEAWTPASGDCASRDLGGPAPYRQSWTFDKVGNRLTQTENGKTLRYTYPAAGQPQPHTLRSVDGAAVTYDAAGNTLTRPGQTLTWDAEGHLATLVESGKTTSFVYDADGTRLLRRDPGGTTLYLAGMELRSAGGTVTSTRYYSFGDSTIAMRTPSGVTWLSADHQGNASVSISTATGQPATIRRQKPYGEPRGGTVTWPNDKGFVGGTNDPTDLTHLGAREYDPSLGRFLSVDPIIKTDDPQQMHGYAYASNTPITTSDPTGLCNGPDGMCRRRDGSLVEETGMDYNELQRWRVNNGPRPDYCDSHESTHGCVTGTSSNGVAPKKKPPRPVIAIHPGPSGPIFSTQETDKKISRGVRAIVAGAGHSFVLPNTFEACLGGWVFPYAGQVCIGFDNDGIGYTASSGGGLTTAPSAAGGLSFAYSNANRLEDLQGWSLSTSGCGDYRAVTGCIGGNMGLSSSSGPFNGIVRPEVFVGVGAKSPIKGGVSTGPSYTWVHRPYF